MGGPGWLAGTLAAAMLVIAAYALGRLAVATNAGRASERDVDAFHVAMGISMAAMLTGSLTTFDGEAWAVVFACSTVWFALRLPWHDAVRVAEVQPVGHRLAHVVSSGSMVYMMLAVPGGSMAAMAVGAPPGARLPALAGVLAVVLVVVLVVAAATRADRVLLGDRHLATSGAAAGGGGGTCAAPGPPPFLAPRTAAATEVAMGLMMASMLALMAWR